MKTELGRVTILVKDCDEAFEFYEKNLGCKKFFDLVMENGKRYLHLGFEPDLSAGIWLSEAEDDDELRRVGNQTGKKPVLVVYTDSIAEFYDRLVANGTTITREPKSADEQQSVQFTDLYGNQIVAVESNK